MNVIFLCSLNNDIFFYNFLLYNIPQITSHFQEIYINVGISVNKQNNNLSSTEINMESNFLIKLLLLKNPN